MKKNQTISSTLVIYKFFKEKQKINYFNYKGRVYSCIKGVLRWYEILTHIYEKTYSKKLKKNSIPFILMLNAIYQIKFLQINNNKVISETLEACNILKLNNLRSFFYATLKKIESLEILDINFGAQTDYFEKLIKQDWPKDYERIGLYLNSEPQNCLTLYNKKSFIDRNKNHKMFSSFLFNERYVVIPETIKSNMLPGFDEGDFYIQNNASLKLLDFLDIKTNYVLKILDACCGVGGKSFIIKDLLKEKCLITSVDNDPKQIDKLRQNSQRLKIIPEKIICTDLLNINDLFDIVIIDAPCTASGNIRKNPEIKFRINDKEIERITKIQEQILLHSWELLKPGGIMIYMTCSILKIENTLQIQKFLSMKNNSKLEIETQYLPKETINGFFVCKIKKLD